MPAFSRQSLDRLSTCDEQLQALFSEIIKEVDCTILVGHRTRKKQNEAFRTGKSKLRWPNSKHNVLPARAVDVAPWPVDWHNWGRFVLFAGYVLGVARGMGIQIRWGGDWNRNMDPGDQKFFDGPHFELI